MTTDLTKILKIHWPFALELKGETVILNRKSIPVLSCTGAREN